MNRIDWTNLGGMPFTQDKAKFLQDGIMGAFQAIARLCGDKTILYGVEVNAGNVSDGWISYNHELILFVGGSIGSKVVISEQATAFTYENNAVLDVQFVRAATCGNIGAFDFSELTPMLPLGNMWLPGDVKEKYCTPEYILANYNGEGYGLNKEKGWRIMAYAVPGSAGKVFVNYDPADIAFWGAVGATRGAKDHTLTKEELPKKNILGIQDQATVPAGGAGMMKKSVAGENSTINDADTGGSGSEPNLYNMFPFPNLGSGNAHNNIQPSFTILKLIKL